MNFSKNFMKKNGEEEKKPKFDIFGLNKRKEKREAEKKKEKKIQMAAACVLAVMVITTTTIGLISESQNKKTEENLSESISNIAEQFKETVKEGNVEATLNVDESINESDTQIHKPVGGETAEPAQSSKLPKYSGNPYIKLNGGQPSFSVAELTTKGYERYSPLDSLGRCRTAIASLGIETMPKPGEERGSISKIYPTGWQQAKYNSITGKYLYNRCHLIGWQLSAENANRSNLITGTRDFNIEGMLPFENMVADYIKETSNHVAYRVTPVYNGENLLASGVQIEAYSVEDYGEGICFNVYVYNVQPGISINYATGASSGNGGGMLDSGSKPAPKPTPNPKPQKPSTPSASKQDYVLNTNSKKFHRPGCPSVDRMSPSNRQDVKAIRQDLINQGYDPCKNCNP